MIKLTDWRGNAYGIGSVIVYPRMSGRSCEICEGVVIDVWNAVLDRDTYRWKRLPEGETAPADVASAWRVKVLPTGKGSRSFYRSGEVYAKDETGRLRFDDSGHVIVERAEYEPVVIKVTENITVINPRSYGP